MVMMLVLTLMFSVPIFTISTYKNDSEKFTYGLRVVSDFFEPPTLYYNGSKIFQSEADYPRTIQEVDNLNKTKFPGWSVQYEAVSLSMIKIFNTSIHSFIQAHKDVRNPLIAMYISN